MPTEEASGFVMPTEEASGYRCFVPQHDKQESLSLPETRLIKNEDKKLFCHADGGGILLCHADGGGIWL
jgi:hypothetical protein